MKHVPHTLPSIVINIFFVIGLLSALSFRILILVREIEPALFRPVWYAGIIGYMIFFSYRYTISIKRRKTIEDYDLINKVRRGELSEEDRQVIGYVLSSLEKSKENLNYLFIFATSFLAMAIDLWIMH